MLRQPHTERRRSATPPTSRRRKPAAVAANTVAARDERAVLRSGTGVVERDRDDGQPVKRSKPRVGHGGQTGLTELHCDGLLKFKSGSDELSHLTTIVSQFVIALAVGQVKFFHADKFDLKLFDLLERER